MNQKLVLGSLCAALAASAKAADPAYQALVLGDGPALYYKFNEPSGNALNYGSLGAAFNAVYNGTPTRTAGTTGGDTGVCFQGVDDYLESLTPTPAAFTGNPTFTAEAVVRVSGSAFLWPPFLHWGSGSTGREVYFSLQANRNNKVYAGFYNGGLRMQGTIPLGRWQHVVWVRQGGGDALTGTTLYIDGVAVPLEPDTDLCCNNLTVNVGSTTFRINRARDHSRYFVGQIDELALYDRALSAAEVAEHFGALSLHFWADVNCDQVVDFFDIDAFLLALFDPAAYAVAFPTCPIANSDVNNDGTVDFFDIDAFLSNLFGC